MASKLVELEDGILVEIAVSPDQAQQISGGFAEKISASFGDVQSMLLKVSRPVIGAWKELSHDMDIEKAEIELGLSFEGEGNLYITRAKAGANLTVKLIFKPQE